MQAIDNGLLSTEVWDEDEEDEGDEEENDTMRSEVFFGPDCSRKVNFICKLYICTYVTPLCKDVCRISTVLFFVAYTSESW